MFILTREIAVGAISTFGTIVGLSPFLYKLLKRAVPVIEKEAPIVARDVSAVEQFFINLARSPIFAGIAAKGKVEAHHVLAELQKSKLGEIAGKFMTGFAQEFGSLDSMGSIEKAALADGIQKEAAKLGLTVTPQEVAAAIHDVATVSANIASTLTPTIKQTVDAVKALGQTTGTVTGNLNVNGSVNLTAPITGTTVPDTTAAPATQS